jgi:hypothetical protein
MGCNGMKVKKEGVMNQKKLRILIIFENFHKFSVEI